MNRCFFCQHKVEPSFKDSDNIEKFISPRKKILGRDRTGVCARHQRRLNKQIKYSRYLGLIPYVSYQGAR